MPASPAADWQHERARVAILARHRSPDDPELVQARRALKLARTEHVIRTAIADAPPLDDATLTRLHALIPSPTSGGEDTERAAS